MRERERGDGSWERVINEEAGESETKSLWPLADAGSYVLKERGVRGGATLSDVTKTFFRKKIAVYKIRRGNS